MGDDPNYVSKRPSPGMALQVSNVEIATLEFGEFLHFPWQNGKGSWWISPRSREEKRFQMSLENAVVFLLVCFKKELCPLLWFTMIKIGFLWLLELYCVKDFTF